jgi:hypothetical protein
MQEDVDRETAVESESVQHTETAIMQELQGMKHAEMVGLTTRKSEKVCEELLDGVRDSLSALGRSNDEEDAEHMEDD